MNDHLILISGVSGTGKSASLRNLKAPEGVMYLCCESGKRLPFPAKFMPDKSGTAGFTITNPMQIYKAFDKAESDPKCHTIVVDTLTFLMEMYETQLVLTAEPKATMQAWGNYAQFFKKLMQQYVAKSTKSVIILAHTMDVLNESTMSVDTMVKVKGSLMNTGIEAYFSNVISTKKIAINKLEPNDLLTITPEEEALGFKHVFQTKLTKDTTGERIRAPMGMWASDETYIDNDAQLVLERLYEYYA